MSNAWTPGPWASFYKSKYDEWHVSIPCEGTNLKAMLCPDGILPGSGYEVRETVARLIAAAPELFDAALKARHRLIKEGFLPSDPTVAALNAALAKARGEQA